MAIFNKKDKKLLEDTQEFKEQKVKECAEKISKILAEYNCSMQIIIRSK